MSHVFDAMLLVGELKKIIRLSRFDGWTLQMSGRLQASIDCIFYLKLLFNQTEYAANVI